MITNSVSNGVGFGKDIPAVKKAGLFKAFVRDLKKWRLLYFMLIPGILFFLIYRYIPLGGIIIAFKDYNIMAGFIDSPWVGFKYFNMIFQDDYFWRVFRNTIIISTYKLIFGFPAPIILALLFNELKNVYFKKIAQTISYLPNFLSWVILYGLFYMFLYRDGLVNNTVIIPLFGKSIDFFSDPAYFRSMLVATDIWKNVGWGTIIYLAALAGVNPELYEAAKIDGAGKIRQIRSITLPEILPVISTVLLLSLGGILNAGFDQVFLMANSFVYNVGDIIDTYVYRVGLERMDYSYSTAVGLFKSVISILLVLFVNKVIKKMGQEGIW